MSTSGYSPKLAAFIEHTKAENSKMVATKVQFFNAAGKVFCEATGKQVAKYRAAPDLLAALEMVRNCLIDASRDSRYTEALEKAQAAIAKAKG